LEWNKLHSVLEENGCKVVILLMDDRGIPKTIDQRMDIAQVLFARLTKMNIPPRYVSFDPLVLSVAVEPEAGTVALETIRRLRSNFPESHVICGLSNVSMGLPGRRSINRTFLSMAICTGLDTLLVDVRDQALLSSIYASKILTHQDSYCMEYLQAYREKKILV
jgi:5-methyltetrahydrofolate--homocysteine methyltransferase